MVSFLFAIVLSVANMAYAATLYLSLHGWWVQQESSGTQLLMHVFVTAPVTLITTFWLYWLSRMGSLNSRFWKVNAMGLLVPILSIQTGVTYYHFDKIGLAVCVLVSLLLLMSYGQEIRKSGWDHDNHCPKSE